MPISCHFSPTRPGRTRVCVKTEIGTSLKQGYDRRVIFFLLSCHSWKFPEGTVKNRYDFSTETRNDWLILSYFQLLGKGGGIVGIFVRRVFRETNEAVLFTLWFTFYQGRILPRSNRTIDRKLYLEIS